MGIVSRFKALNLPADECVVVGGGVIDALGLRQTNDIDVVASKRLFDQLKLSPGWQEELAYGDTHLTKDDAEVWRDWGKEPWLSFAELKADCVVIDGVQFANPKTVLRWKKLKNRPKDAVDIKLLTEYLGSVSV